MPRGADHGENLDAFYASQAAHYDAFRERLLHGREVMTAALDVTPGHRLLDIGGGTGRTLEFLAERLAECESVEILDLCGPLLAVADRRKRRLGWPNVILTQGDICHDAPVRSPVDRVVFSYSLSMIRSWRRALERAVEHLRPGGLLGVVDFYVSEAQPRPGWRRHGAWTRWFWPRWFAHAQVRLRPEVLPALVELTEPVQRLELRGRVPYLFGMRVPYFIYVGRKPQIGAGLPSAPAAGQRPRLSGGSRDFQTSH
jgi:S-adenosylmethionine-diacylgycerolhomoserine-N-methlytransferase